MTWRIRTEPVILYSSCELAAAYVLPMGIFEGSFLSVTNW